MPHTPAKRVRAREVAGLNPAHEDEALDWIEDVSEFDGHVSG
jgi:hypothetical protein